MSHLHITTNVGSLGSHYADRWNPGRIVEVRRNLYNLMNLIKQEQGKHPDSISLQEVGNYRVELQPRFAGPIATDANVHIGPTGPKPLPE